MYSHSFINHEITITRWWLHLNLDLNQPITHLIGEILKVIKIKKVVVLILRIEHLQLSILRIKHPHFVKHGCSVRGKGFSVAFCRLILPIDRKIFAIWWKTAKLFPAGILPYTVIYAPRTMELHAWWICLSLFEISSINLDFEVYRNRNFKYMDIYD